MVSQSMFQRGKSKVTRKRYHDDSSKKKSKKQKPTKQESEEEIESDVEVNSGDELEITKPMKDFHVSEDEDEVETPAQKKVRLAKQYLAELAEQEKDKLADESEDDDDNILDDRIKQRLKEEHLEQIGKLRRSIAHEFVGYDAGKIVTLKHRFQKSPLTCVCFSPDEKTLFTGCKNNILLKWEVATCKQLLKADLCTKNGDMKGRRFTNCMAISSDGKFLAVGDGSTDIQVFCPSTLKFLGLLKGHRAIVNALVFRKGSHQLYSASADRSVRIWSMDDMAFVEALFGHQTPVTGIDAHIRERAITSGGSDRSVRIWKIVEESQLVYSGGHDGSIESVKLINEETFLTSGDDGQLCVWNVNKKKPLTSVKLAHGTTEKGHANWISAITTVLNTDLVASGSCDGFLRVWRLSENFSKITELFSVPVEGFINDLRFMDGGNKIVACVGQEHRLGRWWTQKQAKNCLLIIPLVKSSSDGDDDE
ncbi:U3 small nucleolar RNA-interacting protein 2 [Culicoides brevitarsis]|uniref:U3 small nucleolar RNA-interacting protein 2 n=1 Tax=Culicoides brevitarsis TaxID=469753 RepID=UPI00307C6B6F